MFNSDRELNTTRRSFALARVPSPKSFNVSIQLSCAWVTCTIQLYSSQNNTIGAKEVHRSFCSGKRLVIRLNHLSLQAKKNYDHTQISGELTDGKW